MQTVEHREICGNPNCATCSRRLRFELPEDIPLALGESRLVLFAGAGISTASRGVFPATFYEEVADDLGATNDNLSFPSLMSRFCELRGRRELLIRIKKRFDYLAAFPEVYASASRFHRGVATIPFLDQIFTTNWDELFEVECCANPIVSGEDFAFWDLPGRKVFKLHGSVSHYGSIVATESDYAACDERFRSGLIGSTLKLALATKTIVFAGYSVRDPDFLQTLQLVREEIGAVAPIMYAITLRASDIDRLEKLGLRVIVTDANFFVEELKKELVRTGTMLDDTWCGDVEEILEYAVEAHLDTAERFNCVEYPAVIYTLGYQDGLRHGLEWLLAKSSAGECSHPCDLSGMLQVYREILSSKKRARRYNDVAYVDGYINALLVPLLTREERVAVPLFYLLGKKTDIYDVEELAALLPESESLHRTAFKQAKQAVKRTGNDAEIVFHHSPFL